MKKENFVDGYDIKELPLNVACYVRGVQFAEEIVAENENKIIDYLNSQTKWNLVYRYSDIASGINGYQPDLYELVNDSHDSNTFDLIVVVSMSQLSRNTKNVDTLIGDEIIKVPVYCLEDETLYSSKFNILDELKEACATRGCDSNEK